MVPAALSTPPPAAGHLGLWSGVGLVVANMVGAGVFLSAGFMAQELPPGPLLLAWAIGAVLALCGARAYAEVSRLVPRSGGEYRYLSELWHPALGAVAGWASLLVGFSAPIAVDALAAGAFAQRLAPALNPTAVAAGLILALTAVHALHLKASAGAQNALVAVKVVLLVGFVAVGVGVGSLAWPTWQPPKASVGFPVEPLVGSLFYIAFAFSGWNAAIYASEEFKNPGRDVPRAMLIGCALVAALYLVVNYVFVANLSPEDGTIVFRYASEQVTLGHAVMQRLLGEGAAKVMSAGILLAFVSAMSAMTLVGPRVYAAMAKGGVLPRVFEGVAGQPPRGAVLLQGALALLLVSFQELKTVLSNVGALLTLFAALTAAGLFKVAAKKGGVSKVALAAAGLYVLSALYMLAVGVQKERTLMLWAACIALAAGLGWAAMGAGRRKEKPA